MGLDIVFAAASGAIGAFTGITKAFAGFQNKIDHRLERIEDDLDTLEDRVIRDYVLKEDFRREMESVHKKLDRILDYLIRTQGLPG